MPQTWVAKSGRQVHQWVPFFSKTWYFDGSIFQNFLKFAPKWRKFGTLIGQLFKIFRNLRQNGANFSENFWFLVHGWVTFPSKWVHGWVAFQKSQRHTPTQTKVEYPPPGIRYHSQRQDVENISSLSKLIVDACYWKPYENAKVRVVSPCRCIPERRSIWNSSWRSARRYTYPWLCT